MSFERSVKYKKYKKYKNSNLTPFLTKFDLSFSYKYYSKK